MQYVLCRDILGPIQTIHVPWTTGDHLSYKVLLPPLSEDPPKFKEKPLKINALSLWKQMARVSPRPFYK